MEYKVITNRVAVDIFLSTLPNGNVFLTKVDKAYLVDKLCESFGEMLSGFDEAEFRKLSEEGWKKLLT